MRHDYDIQMCSVESREDTPFLTDQDYTLEAEDAFREDMLFLRPCYPAWRCLDDYNAI